MALPSTARKIEVDGANYQWMVTKSQEGVTLTVQAAGGPLYRETVYRTGDPTAGNRALYEVMGGWGSIGPGQVAAFIRLKTGTKIADA
jgi:hypothetical protein